MAMISLDNGTNYLTAAEAMPRIMAENLWDTVVEFMDDDTRERVCDTVGICGNAEFLAAYLAAAEEDLIVG